MFGGEGQKEVYYEIHGQSESRVRVESDPYRDPVSEAIGRGIAYGGAQLVRGVYAFLSLFSPEYDVPASEFDLVVEAEHDKLPKKD